MAGKRSAEEAVVFEKRIKLASPSPDRAGASDTESIHSYQGYKTEPADETSDSSPSTSSSSSSQTVAPANVEYEVANLEVPNMRCYFPEGSTDDDFDLSDLHFAPSGDNMDNAVLGDTSEENSTSPTSNSDVDPGLPRNDFLDFEYCLLCKTDKKDISYPYCSTCFSWKKNLFPNRPKRRKRFFRWKEEQGLVSGEGNASTETRSGGEDVCDGAFEDSGVGSSEPQASEDTVDRPSQPSTSSSSTKSSGLKDGEGCRVCFASREDGLFVHLKSAHLYGCYECAKKIWYRNGGCPLCRRRVYKVTKLFV